MTPRLTRRGLFAAGIAAVIGTRSASAAPKAVPGLYTAPASTYVSTVGREQHLSKAIEELRAKWNGQSRPSHACNEFTIAEAGRDSWVSDITITITGTNGAILPVADMATQEV